MALFTRMLGKAADVDAARIEKEFSRLLIEGETVKKVYKVIRDYWVFTSKRFVVVEKHGITANKILYHSVPYTSIFRFSIETAGPADLESEITIWVPTAPKPFKQKFNRFLNVHEVEKIIVETWIE
jgi:hypothetical protein